MRALVEPGPCLQEEARRTLAMLKGVQVPERGLNHFTVGDHFRENLLKLKKEILALSSQRDLLERVVLGGFGTGKTHFLSYLDYLLRRDSSPDCVVSRVDLSALRGPHDLQYLVVHGMESIGGGNYARVLLEAYSRMRDNYMSRYRGLTKQGFEQLYGSVLFAVLGHASKGWVRQEILELLGIADPLHRLVQYFAGNTLQAFFEQDRQRADADHVRFVDSYLKLVRRPNAPITAFEEPARRLSYQGVLTDIVFKVLAFSGLRVIVVLIDELESLSRFDENTRDQALVALREFRDTFSRVTETPGYPSIALVCASTDSFFGDLTRHEPALHSRWEFEERHIRLQPMSASDIDNLVFRLRELHYLAGTRLRAVGCSGADGEHEVIQLRRRVLSEYCRGDTPITARRLVARLIAEIERTWPSV